MINVCATGCPFLLPQFTRRGPYLWFLRARSCLCQEAAFGRVTPAASQQQQQRYCWYPADRHSPVRLSGGFWRPQPFRPSKWHLSGFVFVRSICRCSLTRFLLVFLVIELDNSKYSHRPRNSMLNTATQYSLYSLRYFKFYHICCVLGPVLYLLYINEVPNSLKSTMATFADDTTVVAVGETLGNSTRKLQSAVNKVAYLYEIKANKTQRIQIGIY
jgi:hypothetical protein